MQKFIGPKFVIPKYFKKLPYNYYITQAEFEKIPERWVDCPICLDKLNVEDSISNINSNSNSNSNSGEKDSSASNKLNLTENKENAMSESEKNNKLEITEENKPKEKDIITEGDSESRLTVKVPKNYICSEANFENDEFIPTKSKFTLSLERIQIYIKNKVFEYIEALRHHYKKTHYMKSPCKHIFHAECMERWMERKIECPYCRMKIPPLE